MKKCPLCLMQFDDNAEFCTACGGPLEPEENVPPMPEEKSDYLYSTAGLEESSPIRVERPVSNPAPERPQPPVRAAYPANRDSAAPVTPPRGKKTVGGGRRFLSGLLCFFLLLLLLVTAILFMVRRSTTENGLGRIMEGVKLSEFRVDRVFDDIEEEKTFAQLLSEETRSLGLGLDERSAAKVINSRPVKNFFAEQLAAVCKDIYRGRTRYEYNPADMTEMLLSSRMAKVLAKEELYISRQDAESVTQLFTDFGLGDMLSRDTLRDELPELDDALRIGLSVTVLAGLAAVALLLIVLIFAVNRWRAGLAFGDVGFTAFLAGLLLTAASLFPRIMPELFRSLCLEDEAIATAGTSLLGYQLPVTLIILAAGVLLMALGFILRAVGKKRG